MERGHPSFRTQLRSKADSMQKFYSFTSTFHAQRTDHSFILFFYIYLGSQPRISEPSDEQYYTQYLEQGKTVMNMMYEKNPKRNVDVSMSAQAAFIADMNEKAKGIAPLTNVEGIGSSAIERLIIFAAF